MSVKYQPMIEPHQLSNEPIRIDRIIPIFSYESNIPKKEKKENKVYRSWVSFQFRGEEQKEGDLPKKEGGERETITDGV